MAKTLKSFSFYLLILLVAFALGKYGREIYQQLTAPPKVIELDTQKHFRPGTEKVVLYTASWCRYCKQTIQLLRENQVKFTNYDIEKIDEETRNLYESIGNSGVPKIIIGNQVINGFYQSEILKALKQERLL